MNSKQFKKINRIYWIAFIFYNLLGLIGIISSNDHLFFISMGAILAQLFEFLNWRLNLK